MPAIISRTAHLFAKAYLVCNSRHVAGARCNPKGEATTNKGFSTPPRLKQLPAMDLWTLLVNIIKEDLKPWTVNQHLRFVNPVYCEMMRKSVERVNEVCSTKILPKNKG
jgi:hypothetical protein